MPKIIHRALFEKLAGDPEWLMFRAGFRELTGLELELVDRQVEEGALRREMSVRVEVHGLYVADICVNPRRDRMRFEGMASAALEACRFMLELAARHFIANLGSYAVRERDRERIPPVVLKACNWIRGHAIAGEARLTDAARECGMSAGHLSRLFHASTGLRFQEYVTRVRLERACRLLEVTGKTIAEAAFESGFQSISQFNRSFRAYYGTTPAQHRKEHAAGPATKPPRPPQSPRPRPLPRPLPQLQLQPSTVGRVRQPR